jgi:hypothetical protein
MPKAAPPAENDPALSDSYHVSRQVLDGDEISSLVAYAHRTIRTQVDEEYYGVSAPLLADFTDVFQTSIERIAELLTTRYGYRFSLCNAMFYENSFFSDVYIPAHVDKVNDFSTSADFEPNRSIQVWFPIDQTEPNGMHLAPRERNGFYKALEENSDPYEIVSVLNRTYFRSRYTSKILFEWREPIEFDTPSLQVGDLLSFSQKTLHFTEKIKSRDGYRLAVALRFLDEAFEIRPFRQALGRMLAVNDFQFQSTAAGGESPESGYLGDESRGKRASSR